MNHIKTMLCGHFIGIDKLERLKLLQNDPSSTSLIKGLASADALCRASRCGSPIRRNHLTPGGAKRQCGIRGEHMTISAQVIDTIVEWIDDNLHQPLRIDDIARHAGYSKWHLQLCFYSMGEPGALYSRKGSCCWPPAICVTPISGSTISA